MGETGRFPSLLGEAELLGEASPHLPVPWEGSLAEHACPSVRYCAVTSKGVQLIPDP